MQIEAANSEHNSLEETKRQVHTCNIFQMHRLVWWFDASLWMGFDVAVYIRAAVTHKTTMAYPSHTAKDAANVVPLPVGRVAKAMPIACKVKQFLEMAPGLANSPAHLAKIQKILKDGRPGRDGNRMQKGYCKKVNNVLVRVFWMKPRWVFGLYRAETCKRGQTNVLVEEKKAAKDFLEGLLWLQERVKAFKRFGFCRTCDKELPDIGMYCAECVITSMIEGTHNAD